MSDAEWDADDFEPEDAVKPAVPIDKWVGEDEDDDVKDNWDDEEDDKGENEETDGAQKQTAVQVKKKRPLKEVIAEKEERKRKELEERKKQDEEARANLTPEEKAAEKLRQQKLQEEADLQLAKEMTGATDSNIAGDSIDLLNPVSKDDFNRFGELLKNKITKCETSAHYVPFLEILFRDVSLSLESEDIKKLASTLNALANEKAKQQKGTKGKKKAKPKANLKAGKDADLFGDYQVEAMDEFDDFM